MRTAEADVNRTAIAAALALAALMGAHPLEGAFSGIGQASVQSFDGSSKTWRPVQVILGYQASPESLRCVVQGMGRGKLYLSLHVKSLPHYGEWVEARRKEGGAAWEALAPVLGAVEDGTLVAMSPGPLPESGPLEITVGLREQQRFDSLARISGTLRADGDALVFDPVSVAFDDSRAALAWALALPMARKQARRATGQTGP
jgi:hypothetical protein